MIEQRSVRRAVKLPMQLVVLLLASALPVSAANKQEMYGQMMALTQQMRAIKANSSQAGQYASLAAQYRQLSDAMGGDDPANMNQGPSSASPEGGGQAAPPSCVGATDTTASTNVPVAIADVAVSSSTLTVVGTNTFLYRISLDTSITHTFAADLDITLQSPSGTVVTLSTDNGSANNNVFAGTNWRDDAGDAATDHIYADLTVASPLIPEEAMGAFYGEDPNGLWTLTVSDDLSGDTGTINSWSVTIVALTTAPINVATSHPSTDTPVVIADVATSTSTLAVAGGDAFVCKVGVTANITHTFAADLDITLQSPFGPVTTLSTDNGGGNNNVFAGTVWDDEANPGGQVPYVNNNGLTTDQLYADLTVATPLVPEGAMGAFAGGNANGNWVLSVVDDLGGDTGTINSWSLQVTTCSCVIPDADLEIPTLDFVGLAAFGLLLAGGAFVVLRRRRAA